MIVIRRFVLLGLLCAFALTAFTQERYPFEKEIVAYRNRDRQQMPPSGGTLFVGSSSIRLWNDLEARFPNEPIIRRGVGGCQLAHIVTHYMDSIVYPYQANRVFVYAGENDIAAGRSAKEVVADFKKLWKLLRKQNPDVEIFYLSIKPSSSRLAHSETFAAANAAIKTFLARKKGGTYLDMASVLLDGGKPDDRLFRDDRLHLNSRGYDRWQAVLKPYLAN